MSKLLELNNVSKYFNAGKGRVLHAVDGVSLSIAEGETLGVVGESGCGKSTLGRVALRLHDATGGSIAFNGEDITHAKGKRLKELRQDMQMIFQDPYSSLNPRMSVQDLIAEPILVSGMCKSKAEVYERVEQLMDTVGLAKRLADAYPHELDGGRRQRIGVARAIALNPKFIVCDEPVSALDVSIQAQILNLLMDQQEERNLAYMFITHDLSVVRHISNHIAVMYLGKCVELCQSKRLFKNPAHPYTKALLSAIPVPSIETRNKKPQLIKGEVTNPINPKPGCRFAPRCPYATEECLAGDIPLREIEPGHSVACCKV
ncbi:MAG: ATP-binding cassette domain-containing protein [Clostridia bacterium]|nr:ATP-binding cassette domain-containing protein [Clostridia bacterium]